ncbi:EamA family transporter [Candidatus Woesearchaeota archaeon]|nr:EamA family transporter [Candidatus Woesearchaeota archaeon]
MIIPFIAAIAGAISLILSKRILKNEILDYRLFASFGMIQLFVIMLIVSPLMFKPVPSMFNVSSIYILIIIAVIAAAYNLFYYHGLSEDTLVDAESVVMMAPLLTTVLSIAFFVDERNILIIIPAIIAGGALLLSHIKKHHLFFSRGDEYLLLALGLVSIEAILLKLLLRTFPPFTAYFLRVAVVAFILWLVVRPNFTKLSMKTVTKMAIFNIFVLVSFTFTYWSYKVHGIVYSTLVLTLLPVLVLVWAFSVEREKLEIRKFVAVAVILASILAVQLLLWR